MIVISAGVHKAGSGLYFNLTNDLLIAAGMQDVREVKKEHGLADLLKNYNCNIGEFLGIDYSHIDLQTLYAKYRVNNLDDSRKDCLHFNVGKAGRFRTAMTEEDLEICNRHFSKYYKKLGYPNP